MKTGAENRKKTVTLGVVGAAALCGLLYDLFSVFGPSTPPPTVAPPSSAPAPVLHRPSAATTTAPTGERAGAVPGVSAQVLAKGTSNLDPTLNAESMLRTESLVYSGSGRNIFSATYVAPVLGPVNLPRNVPPPRPGPVGSRVPVPTGPPPVAPIPLKFFGTAQRTRGVRQAFLLSGDDVYLAAAGDIVARRYKVDQILPYGIQVTDLVTNNTQTLPMQQQ